jgi:hypothetical protein
MNRPYSVRRANCQHAAEDVSDYLTEGRSILTPAPIRRVPEIILNKLDTEGLTGMVIKAKKSGGYISRAASSPQDAVDEALRGTFQRARPYGF